MPRTADWYFDYLSPYAYLQFESFARLPDDLEVALKPVLFAGLLGYWDNLGPAEIPAKRRQTYRYCHWLAGKRGVPFKAPPRHPFNPLAVLRLTLALESTPTAVHAIFRHIWGDGKDAQDPAVLAKLAASLGVDDLGARINDPSVKQQLRDNTDEAVRRGVFGIPTFVMNDEVFWGDDLTDMFLEYLDNPALLEQNEMGRLADLPTAAQRKESRL
ncbi:MAG: 2-hydroxychromene-2-carboxylate isomerase [Rhodospirillaceae bacterium]|nr:2-hydroxychromene-2-carboxylate isomerase [Rhodospirillaceae bacterium]